MSMLPASRLFKFLDVVSAVDGEGLLEVCFSQSHLGESSHLAKTLRLASQKAVCAVH